jgi:hypothetical protein
VADDLSPQIEQTALSPSSVTVDGRVVMARPVAELIQADRYLAGKAARKLKNRGITFSKILLPGHIGEAPG